MQITSFSERFSPFSNNTHDAADIRVVQSRTSITCNRDRTSIERGDRELNIKAGDNVETVINATEITVAKGRE